MPAINFTLCGQQRGLALRGCLIIAHGLLAYTTVIQGGSGHQHEQVDWANVVILGS